MEWLVLCFAIASLSINEPKYELLENDARFACQNAQLIIDTSNEYDVNKFILSAIIWNESRWNPTVISSAGACGLTQVLRGTFKLKCKDLFKPKIAIDSAAKILKIFKDEYKNKFYKNKILNEDAYSIACYAVGVNCLESKYAINHSKRILKLASKYEQEYKKYEHLAIGNKIENLLKNKLFNKF